MNYRMTRKEKAISEGGENDYLFFIPIDQQTNDQLLDFRNVCSGAIGKKGTSYPDEHYKKLLTQIDKQLSHHE